MNTKTHYMPKCDYADCEAWAPFGYKTGEHRCYAHRLENQQQQQHNEVPNATSTENR